MSSTHPFGSPALGVLSNTAEKEELALTAHLKACEQEKEELWGKRASEQLLTNAPRPFFRMVEHAKRGRTSISGTGQVTIQCGQNINVTHQKDYAQRKQQVWMPQYPV